MYVAGNLCYHRGSSLIRATWAFIRFVGSPEAQRVVVKTYVENGYGSFIDPEKLKRFGYEEYVKTVPAQWAELLSIR